MVPLVKRHLGFNVSHFRKVPAVADGGLQHYLLWMKTNLARGLPVIFIARTKDGRAVDVGRFGVV